MTLDLTSDFAAVVCAVLIPKLTLVERGNCAVVDNFANPSCRKRSQMAHSVSVETATYYSKGRQDNSPLVA